MSDSSDELSAMLGKVDTRQVCQLLSILASTKMHDVQFIEQRYSDGSRNFKETLRVLEELSWIVASDNGVHLTPAAAPGVAASSDEEEIRNELVKALVADGSPFRAAIAKYVQSFRLEGANLVRRPSMSDRTRERPVRDFLMDLRRVGYRQAEDTYVLEEIAAPLYVWALNHGRNLSQPRMADLQRRREELGFAAELVVVELERRRIGSAFASRVEHVSASLPLSCYDIKSVTVDESSVAERFIEVKAVDPITMRFYWSRSEIDAATVLGPQYFLYLLPYRYGGGFSPDGLAIYRDPARSLLPDQEGWSVEEDVVVCQRRLDRESSASSAD